MKVRLLDIAHARSGDKGDTANVGLIALTPAWYPVLVRHVTQERVARHFAGQITGDVVRFELPNLHALNFLLHGALDGGGTSHSRPTRRARSTPRPCCGSCSTCLTTEARAAACRERNAATSRGADQHGGHGIRRRIADRHRMGTLGRHGLPRRCPRPAFVARRQR